MVGSPGSGLFGQGGGFGSQTVSGIGSAVSDILVGQTTAEADRLKARGDLAEAATYDLAGKLAKTSGELQRAQQERQFLQTQGAAQNEISAAGFTESGSALDILRSNAQQGGIANATILENEQVQVKEYDIMKQAALDAASTEQHLAGEAITDSYINAGISAVSAFASLA